MTLGISTLTAISPNKSLLAIHTPSSENDDASGSSQRVLIKCYDSKVTPGTLKFTLSATSATIAQIAFPQTSQHTKPQFLIARTTSHSILIFDLSRGVLAHTIPLLAEGALIHIAGKEGLLYALLHNTKDSKVVVLIHDLVSGKTTRKVKFGSCPIGKVGGMGVHPVSNYVAVQMDTKLKVLNWKTGEKLKQFKKTSLEAASPESSKLHLGFVGEEGTVLFVSSGSVVTLLSTETGKILANIAEEDVIISVDVRFFAKLKSLFLAVTTPTKATLYQVSTSTKEETLKAFGTLTPSLNTNQYAGYAYFASGMRGDTEVAFAEFTQKGIGNHVVDVSVTMREYIDPSGTICSGELLNVNDASSLKEPTSSLKKRKATSIVLGPGEDGGEALRVTDQKLKKTKVDDDGNGSDWEDHDDFNLEGSEDQEQTIAQRLALLSSELERDTEDDEDDHLRNEIIIESNNSQTKFNAKKATSESLVTLLRQALTSNDDSQLEVAFQVSDKKVIENSILALATSAQEDEEGTSDIIVTLLSKLVTRLSRKPARAQSLAFWVRNVLVALISTVGQDGESWKMGKKERDVAVKLGPLRNMLNERVECLPLLMRLEGRLALLGKI
jgi:hypothetical protein